ncbi:MAG: YbaK/EbsC family protein [Acidimicrobiales bacterium]|jgi:prolyl-tRNA editing enzyme YbaK/EbsC (Cys-tRNA(Pro) deacylase)
MAKEDAVSRFCAAAAQLSIEVEPVRYPDGTRTAAEAAAAIGCELSQIAKSLVCTGPNGAVLALTAGHNRLDLEKLSAIVGGDVRMATPDEARAASGYAIGGTPPFAYPVPVPTWIDPALLTHELVYAAAGAPDACFPITSAELQQITGAEPVDFVVSR